MIKADKDRNIEELKLEIAMDPSRNTDTWMKTDHFMKLKNGK